MKIGISARKISIILLALSLYFTNFAYFLSSQTNESLLKPTEILYVGTYVYTGIYPERAFIGKNIYMDFINITELLPLNASLSAFNEHFQSAKYALVLWKKLGFHS